MRDLGQKCSYGLMEFIELNRLADGDLLSSNFGVILKIIGMIASLIKEMNSF